MAATTYTVKKGDTLSKIASANNTTVAYLAKINNIANPDKIYIGQVIKLVETVSAKKPTSNTTSSNSSSSSKSSNTAKITGFGLQSGTDRTIYATWSWNKSNTDKYDIRWYYSTGDGVRFIGSQEEKSFTNATPQSTYTAPENAVSVKFQVKPISKTKTVNNKEVYYWTASWSIEQVYTFAKKPPIAPPAPTVTIKDYTLTAKLENLDVDGKQIEFQVVQDDSKVYKTGKSNITTSMASYSCTISDGHDYKVRCRTIKDKTYSEWSDYSSNAQTKPDAPSKITGCKATSKTSVRLTWGSVKSAETYDIEYAIKKEYLGASNATTTINNVTKNTYEITGLAGGERYFFRVRAVNSQGTSSWTDPVSIIIGEAPAAPTTWSIATAMVGESIRLHWVHNSKDESNETKAEITVIVNGISKTYTSVDNNPDEDENRYYDISTSSYTSGATIRWKVRTAGVTGEFGDWSVERTIDVYAPPSLSLSIMDNNGDFINTIETFPFYIEGVAGPSSQTPIGYHVTIIANESYETIDEIGNVKMVTKGEEIYSKFYDIDRVLLLEITPGSLDLENNISYTIECVVTMNTGLNASASMDFTVAWAESTYYPNAEITFDEETLCVHIHPYCDTQPIIFYKVEYDMINGTFHRTDIVINPLDGTSINNVLTEEFEDIVFTGKDGSGQMIYFTTVESPESQLVEGVTLSVYRREYDGTFVEIGSDIVNTDNTYITDPHPSLDLARYRIVARDDATGAISYNDIPAYYIGVKSVIIQWDESWGDFETTSEEPLEEIAWAGSMLKLPYNIDVSDSNTIDVSLINYVGRQHPVSYYGTQLGITSTWNVDIAKNDKNTLYGLRRLAIYMGDVYVREPSGSGYWANISVSFNQNHCETVIPVTLNITRVEGGM